MRVQPVFFIHNAKKLSKKACDAALGKQVVFWDAGGSTRVSTLVRPEYGLTQP